MIPKKNFGFIYILIETMSIQAGEMMVNNTQRRKITKREKTSFSDDYVS